MEYSAEFSIDGAQSSSSKLPHPLVTAAHVAFRTLAVVVYLFGSLFSSSFVGVFVAVVLLLAVDFWTVKNVTGRIMVGLRWWNYIDEEGVSRWMFEARNGNSQHMLSASEVRIFWTSLAIAPALWLVLFLTALSGLRFQWMVLVVIGLTLSASNLLGYLRCRYGASADEGFGATVSKAANAYMQRRVLDNVFGMFKAKDSSSSQNFRENI